MCVCSITLLFFEADQRLFPEMEASTSTLESVIQEMAHYTDAWVEQGGRAHHVTRHLVHLLARIPGNKYWRRTLSEGAVKPGATGDIVRQAWAGAIERMQSLEFADLP